MWCECSKCGGQVQRARPPVLRHNCGTAGVIFVPLEVDDPVGGVPDAEDLRSVWLSAGLEYAQQA